MTGVRRPREAFAAMLVSSCGGAVARLWQAARQRRERLAFGPISRGEGALIPRRFAGLHVRGWEAR